MLQQTTCLLDIAGYTLLIFGATLSFRQIYGDTSCVLLCDQALVILISGAVTIGMSQYLKEWESVT